VAVRLTSVDALARRRKAIELATAAPVNRDTPASAFMHSAGSMDAVMCDVQREATDRVWGDGRGNPSEPQGYRVGLLQLQATLEGVRSAHAAGDRVALRGELVALASQAVVWASDLPAPIKRRTRAKAAA
jgi:hypothetical protein